MTTNQRPQAADLSRPIAVKLVTSSEQMFNADVPISTLAALPPVGARLFRENGMTQRVLDHMFPENRLFVGILLDAEQPFEPGQK